jgi:hypothetical protein
MLLNWGLVGYGKVGLLGLVKLLIERKLCTGAIEPKILNGGSPLLRRLVALIFVLLLLPMTQLFAGQTMPADVEAGLKSKGFSICPGAV